MRLRLSDIAQWVGGRLVGNGESIVGVSTDTRTITPGALFVALKGERYDAHDFVVTAHDRGATAALVEREVDAHVPQIVVGDTLAALGAPVEKSHRTFRPALHRSEHRHCRAACAKKRDALGER
jgi:UDP-N-acetylmuramoyl-tripeptide--D-alanyl-D-alanine ligase